MSTTPPLGPGYGYGHDFESGYDLSSMLDIGLGTPDGEPAPATVDPRKEYVVAADQLFPDRGYGQIEERFGGPLAWHGVAEYERMYNTPVVGSSLNALRAAVLANDLNLLPAIKPKLGVAVPGQKDGTNLEADMAAEIADSNKRLLDAWETPAPMVLWEFMESDWLGHVLGEVVSSDVVGGPDDGLLAITEVNAKDRRTYRFRVNRRNKVIGIRALALADQPDVEVLDSRGNSINGNTEMRLFDPEHFVWMTNDPHRGDPRGRSCLRMAHYHWQLLMELWPLVWEGWKQFGIPVKYGTCAPNAQKMVPLTDKSGKPLPGPGVTSEYAMAMQIAGMNAGKSAAGPYDSDVKVIESTKDSSVAAGGITLLEGQIIRAILLQMRATMEAKHGSKADSETGQDIMGTLVRYKRKQCERFIRKLLIKQNVRNYGAGIAMRLTPLVDLGGTEHQDFAANSSGVATLFQSSYFTDSQLPYVDTFLGLPQRQPGDQRVGPQGISPDVPPTVTPAPAAETGVTA